MGFVAFVGKSSDRMGCGQMKDIYAAQKMELDLG